MEKNPNSYWTLEKCQVEALKYDSRSDFQFRSGGAYRYALKNKSLDKICGHMEEGRKPNGYWTKKRCRIEALPYTERKKFQKGSSGAYQAAKRNKWLDKICEHMVYVCSPTGYWTKEMCRIEALPYTERKKFQKGSNKAYQTAQRNGWLDEICEHMVYVCSPTGLWTFELCQEEALKNTGRKKFAKGSSGAYNVALKNKWLDEICDHMIVVNPNGKIYCYAIEFPLFNSAYIGICGNLDDRFKNYFDREKKNWEDEDWTCHNEHLLKHFLNNESCDWVEINEVNFRKNAKEFEGRHVERYRDMGYEILNIAPVGSLGGCTRIHSKDKCIQAAQNCTTKKEFRVLYPHEHSAASNNKWLAEIYEICKLVSVIMPCGYWNLETLQVEALKYNSKEEFKKGSSGAHKAAYELGCIEEICGHMEGGKKPAKYWTLETCGEEAKKYGSRKQFEKGSGSAYNVSSKNKWLDEFYKRKAA